MKTINSLIIALFLLIVPAINAQQIKKIVMPLEYAGTPVPNGMSGAEKVSESGAVSNISVAEITVLLPESEKPTQLCRNVSRRSLSIREYGTGRF